MAEPLFDVVGVGINSVDRVAVLPGFPQPSGPMSKMRLRKYETQCGGQTATAVVACARLGLRAAYIGAVGNDAEAALVRDALALAGVDTAALVAREATTRFALILIDQATGQRAVLWDFDDRLKLTEAELPSRVLGSARLVHVDDVDGGAAVAAARAARAAGVPVTSDIDQVTELTGELLDAVSIAIFAEHVPHTLAGTFGKPNLSTVHDALLALPRRGDQVLVVTQGEGGATALDNDGFHHQSAFAVDAVDTTGAGDIFRAGFICALLEGKSLDEQLRYGNAAAAVSCTRMGAMASAPTRAEVEEMLRRA